MPKPELEAEVAAALGSAQGTPEEEAQDALSVIAASLVGIEKHLFALVYLQKTMHPADTGVTFVPDVFNAIYDDSDPFAEVDKILQAAKEGSGAGGASA
jgi:hypothetical protein